jgi:Flp pilus assembly protein TadB
VNPFSFFRQTLLLLLPAFAAFLAVLVYVSVAPSGFWLWIPCAIFGCVGLFAAILIAYFIAKRREKRQKLIQNFSHAPAGICGTRWRSCI